MKEEDVNNIIRCYVAQSYTAAAAIAAISAICDGFDDDMNIRLARRNNGFARFQIQLFEYYSSMYDK